VAADAARVAFELDLPVLHKLEVKDLIRIREHEQDTFERFRDRLRLAIKERMNLEPSAKVDQLANQIKEDLLEPELRRIRERLKAADDVLYRKTGTALGVGAILTACGIVTGLVPLATVGAATVAGGLVLPSQEHTEKVSEISLSDMFFLWRLDQETH
jgi:hypothetical protein